jgi:hypothetical protein
LRATERAAQRDGQERERISHPKIESAILTTPPGKVFQPSFCLDDFRILGRRPLPSRAARGLPWRQTEELSRTSGEADRVIDRHLQALRSPPKSVLKSGLSANVNTPSNRDRLPFSALRHRRTNRLALCTAGCTICS